MKFFVWLYRLIGSTLFTSYLIIFTIPYGVLCLFCYKLPYKIRYGIITFWTRTTLFMLMVCCGIRYKVDNADKIPAFNCVILSNHQSAWETFALPDIFPNPLIILKKELLHIPFFGWGLRLLEPIAIDRKDKANAMEQVLTKGTKLLQEGRWILIFPEGTRVPPGETLRYRAGGALLACQAGYPIIPVAHNAGKYWPKRGLKSPGIIHAVIGPVIETKGRRPEEVLAIARNWIETTLLEL